MKRTLTHASAIASIALFALSSASFAADEVIATVNGATISKERAETLLFSLVERGSKRDKNLEDKVREELIRREVLSQAAIANGVDKLPDVREQIALASQTVLIGGYLRSIAESFKPSEAQIKEEYTKAVSSLGGKEYMVSHIVVKSEDEASDIIKQLNEKADFAELAKKSIDPGSKDAGGEIGWVTPDSLVDEFASAMVRMTKGEISAKPVKTSFGYHVIKLEDTREAKPPALAEVREQIIDQLRDLEVKKHILELREKAKVE